MPSTDDDPRQGELLLESRDLVKTYKKRRVVDRVSLKVRRGEIVGLLGSNGAGKTTTFRMIVGMIRPDSGSVQLLGKDVTRWPMYKRAQYGLGYLSQEKSSFRKMSVEDNILAVLEAVGVPRAKREERLEQLLAELDLTRLRRNLADTLSGGEGRRLEVTRALASRPSLILLDEPFAGVDPIVRQEIQGIVRDLAKRQLGILITDHSVQDMLRITTRSYIIHQGKVLKEGSSLEISQDEKVRQVYLGDSMDHQGPLPSPEPSSDSQ
ncbi:MAG: LPS export ABC transporter ATP-binding protein [Planctomycetota bacterium]|nr:MAG: LPS export ABC transporter ATP-binding protein [Planctomycetota bacterium]